MTKQMIGEFLPEGFYVITKSGNKEYWRFSEEKAEKTLMAEGGGEALMIMKLFGGSIRSASSLSSLTGGPMIPERIVFTNGKVTSVTN